VTKEVDRESRRAAESQGRTTITVDAVTPLAIFISPESGPESSAPLLSSLDDFPTLREMLGLPDRESSPEKMDDDDNNGLKRLFWIPPDVESPSSGLKPSSSAPKPPSPVSEPVSSASAPEPVSSASAPELLSPTPAPEPPFPAPRASALQAYTVHPGPVCYFSRAQPAEASQGWKHVDSHSLLVELLGFNSGLAVTRSE
jgi:hypothetical protein